MPVRRGTLFVKPSAGARLPGREFDELRAASREANIEVIEITPGLDVSAAIRERMHAGTRLFIAAGGDGTIHHVMQPLVRTDASLAILPIGTYNHFARDLGIPIDWREALAVAIDGTSREVDVARINDRYFVNNVSMGLYPDLVAKREERGRDYPRWKARLYAAYVTLRRYHHVNLLIESEHHQEAIRTHVFMVSNNSYDLSTIGIESPRPLLTEGRITVYWLPHLPRLALMRFAAHYLAGRVTTAAGFRHFRTAAMKVHTPRLVLRAGVDGEVFTFTPPLVITTVPQSLLVRVPREPSAAQ